MSLKTIEHMIWHKSHNVVDRVMMHPSDGEAWKHFNSMHPQLLMESRLYLWFLSMVIPNPNSPSWNIDVCFQPLINELKQLWLYGALTYDVSRKHNFLIKTALMWTINYFLAYVKVFGCSMHEKLACSWFMKNNKAFTLTNCNKNIFFYGYRRFLPTYHKSERTRTSLFIELKGMLHRHFFWVRNCMMWCYSTMTLCLVFNPVSKSFFGFGLTYNWVKQSIFLGVFLLEDQSPPL